jgi:H+-translocating NAD(P) transhydrogenase subunit alpha
MYIAVLKEHFPGEQRISLVPKHVEKLVKKGMAVLIEKGLGETIHYDDAAFEKVGAEIVSNRELLLSRADVVVRLRKPPVEDIALMKQGALNVSFLDPFNNHSLLEAFSKHSVDAFCMELVPRSTRAQKMDALSSQASLGGYVAVMLAAERFDKILPMMSTPAGTISPARVFIIGAGVAGLQAIATAKRLGARVEAFDTRPVVEGEVRSLGARFIKIDVGETGQTEEGYAKQLTPEQLEKQRQGIERICSESDIVITTAQVFGRKAPLIITKEMVAKMKPGAIVVDMAVETGGNVECSELDREIHINGVNVIGHGNLPGRVAFNASEMYSGNIYNVLDEYWDEEEKKLVLSKDDPIVQGALVVKDGKLVNEMLKHAIHGG